MKAINKEGSLEEFVPRYLNRGNLVFTRDDMGSDRAMMIVFLYIVIAIMAFVLALRSATPLQKRQMSSGLFLPAATPEMN